MAKREFVEERLAKAQERFEKKQGTLAKHVKAVEKMQAKIAANGWSEWAESFKAGRNAEIPWDAYWLYCDIESKMENIEETKKAIAKAKADIEKYTAELEKMDKAEQGRNVPAITEFLDNWEAEAIEYFTTKYPEYREALAQHKVARRAISDWREKEKADKRFASCWSQFMAFDNGAKGFEETMRSELRYEKNRKYDDIIARTKDAIGTITDASDLRVDMRCNLNGFIVGENGKAEVNSIYAGGWNIQCLHVRTLIHKVA